MRVLVLKTVSLRLVFFCERTRVVPDLSFLQVKMSVNINKFMEGYKEMCNDNVIIQRL